MIDAVKFILGVKILQMLGQLGGGIRIVTEGFFHDEGDFSVSFAAIVGYQRRNRLIHAWRKGQVKVDSFGWVVVRDGVDVRVEIGKVARLIVAPANVAVEGQKPSELPLFLLLFGRQFGVRLHAGAQFLI